MGRWLIIRAQEDLCVAARLDMLDTDKTVQNTKPTSKSARQGRRGIEKTDSQCKFATRVHARQIQHHAGQQTALSYTQECPNCDEAAKVTHEAKTHGYDSPRRRQARQEDLGGHLFEKQIAWQLAAQMSAAPLPRQEDRGSAQYLAI